MTRNYAPVAILSAAATEQWDFSLESNCVSHLVAAGNCWANPETNPPPWLSPPTHWFTDACDGGWWSVGNQRLYKEQEGYYHNWDFQDPDLITNIDHHITISVFKAVATFDLIDHDSGEFRGLIFGDGSGSNRTLDCY